MTASLDALVPEQLLALMPGGVVVFDAEGVVCTANPSAVGLLQASGAPVGHAMREVLGDDYAQIEWAIAAATRTGEMRSTPFLRTSADGEARVLHVSIRPVEAAGRLVFVTGLVDVTETHRVLLQQAQSDKAASLSLLSAGIAHEFNNLWTSVQGFAELARSRPEFTDNLVAVCLEQSGRASRIVRSMLSFSQSDAGPTATVRLQDMFDALRRLISHELRSRGISLHMEVTDALCVRGDEGMLQQVFLQLLINACHSMRQGGEIHVRLRQEDAWAKVEVSDSGTGLSAEQMKHLFEPFYTTKGALGGNAEEDGTGLGLTLCQNLIQLHEGRLEVESCVGAGSTFHVFLPIIEKQTASEQEPTPTPVVGLPEGLRVVVLDTHRVLWGLLSAMMPQQEVVAVHSLPELDARLVAGEADVVLLDDDDENLPEAMGRAQSTRRPAVAIVVLAGRDSDLGHGADSIAVVRKPFTYNDLMSALSRVSR